MIALLFSPGDIDIRIDTAGKNREDVDAGKWA
jgi:hypothetical protein